MTVMQGIAGYIVRTRYGDIPFLVIERAKGCIMDSIGVALYGSTFEASQIALAVVGGASSPGGGASILCGGAKVIPCLASFINGVMAHVTDFDDVLFMLRGHPSCVLMPVAIAACESAGGNGKDFLTSFVVGSEIAGKMGRVMAWQHYELGWHSTGTIGALGAAATASKALNLDRDKTANALGIAASSAAGLRVNFGTMTKSYHVGHAAMVGVLAAQLAEKGFDASSVVLEDNMGFARLFGCDSEISSVAADLGIDYALSEIILKPYPSCVGTHSAVEAILKIREEINAKLEDIAQIEVRVRPAPTSSLFYHNPQTTLQGKFSMEFCISAALVFGKLGISEFERECVFNPHVRGLMGKIIIIPDIEMGKISMERRVLSPVQLKMKTVEGEEFCETILEARGSPSNPMSQDEIREKFRECARYVLPDSGVETALETIERLETLKNISELTSNLIS